MVTVADVKRAISDTSFEFYGMRVDDGIQYNVGDIANNSHQLYQDPDFNEEGELIYPYVDQGLYSGFYDAGELGGTCAIGFDPEEDESILKAIDAVGCYYGDYIHILGGNCADIGNDIGEVIISDAEVLGVYGK